MTQWITSYPYSDKESAASKPAVSQQRPWEITMSNPLTFLFTSGLNYDIFTLHGDVTVGTIIGITAELNKYTAKNLKKDLVIDLAEVEYIDSSGIRLLVNLNKKMELLKRQFYLLSPSKSVLHLFKQTNMEKVLAIIDSMETLEKKVTANNYARYLPYTTNENDLLRLNCSCAVCGSSNVIAYLVDQNALEWRWINDEVFPTAFKKGTEEVIDYFGITPIVCLECFMTSIKISDFNIASDDTTVIRSTLKDGTKNLLSKAIKKMKKMVESEEDLDVNVYFLHPRNHSAAYKIYQLAELCARTTVITKTDASPFDVGYLNYLAIRYATFKQKEEHINNCRTWFTQVANNASEYSIYEVLVSYFSLFISDLDLNKTKEANQRLNEFSGMIEKLPPSVTITGITSPQFWYTQAELIWKKEISEKSSEIK